mgnify:CR=1 FL=1
MEDGVKLTVTVAQGEQEMGLAHPRRPEEQDVFLPLHEGQGRKLLETVLGQSAFEPCKVEVLQALRLGHAGELETSP